MRKIEQQMVNALMCGKGWRKDNTIVTARHKSVTEYEAHVFLHNNKIAVLFFQDMGRSYPTSINISLRGFNTRTTRSRLNALLQAFVRSRSGIYCKNFEPYLVTSFGDAAMDSTTWYNIPT